MTPTEKPSFYATLHQVHAYYRVELSEWALSVWWDALRGFDLVAIRDALGRHAVNPDTGQFCPRVADVVKMMQGTSLDGALSAWAKVERSIRQVGPYRTVVFDDPLIHRVIEDMGGWVALNAVKEDELPFRAKEFENRYRGFAHRMQIPEYSPTLIGIAEGQNALAGFRIDPPLLIGNPEAAKLVMERGKSGARLTFTPLDQLATESVERLENHA